MEGFRDLISDLKLVDIPTNNGMFTWNNQWGGQHQGASCLDIFLVTEGLINRDIFFEASIIPGLGSDH